jgi:hypothetical protein
MYAHRMKARFTADQPLVLPLPKGSPEGEVEVIVLFPEAPVAQAGPHSLREFNDWLQQQPHGQRTQEEIDRQIAEERSAWE